eukprot:TRINITY_DN1045_c2_g1_i1.p1 TRINITY_DN1045_c2_g1~~TRINITY_DN1045_c2_g1_i1.p1  ORF type:complete len:308 (+),score=31.19 TRINITY_DN1045_c2_g1_i1:493-1416(+)
MKWSVLLALNKLFLGEELAFNGNLVKDNEINFLLSTEELKKNVISNTIYATPEFRIYYNNEYKKKVDIYKGFINNHDSIIKNPFQWLENDIKSLMLIEKLKDEIKKRELTSNQIASEYFHHGDAKYLNNRGGLKETVRKIIGYKKFPNEEKTLQWIDVLECKDPQLIVLCENIDFLKMPDIPRDKNIELRCARGSNTAKLAFSPDRDIPIYYSCDWDYAGLYHIYKNVKKYIPDIKLLYPNKNKAKDITTSKHKSLWRKDVDYSKLNKVLQFNKKEIDLIDSLISSDEWIEEESNNLIDMLSVNGAI